MHFGCHLRRVVSITYFVEKCLTRRSSGIVYLGDHPRDDEVVTSYLYCLAVTPGLQEPCHYSTLNAIIEGKSQD